MTRKETISSNRLFGIMQDEYNGGEKTGFEETPVEQTEVHLAFKTLQACQTADGLRAQCTILNGSDAV